MSTPKQPAFDGDVFAWCETHDSHPAEGWLQQILDGTISLDEMRAAILEDRSPREGIRKRLVLVVEFDVTELRDEEIDALATEVAAQGERGEAHPEAPLFGSRVIERRETPVGSVGSVGERLARFLAHVNADADKVLTPAENAEYEQIRGRLQRAGRDLRSAQKKGDAKKIAAAESAIARCRAAREAFCAPRVGHRPAPRRILVKESLPWTGPKGRGVHRLEVEMVLDHKDLSGPEYITVRTILDEGGPSTNPRGTWSSSSMTWEHLESEIQRGRIIVLNDAEVAP